jgi:hypothetical protein
MRAQATFHQMMQHPGEDVLAFASRLQEQAGLLGTLCTAEELKCKFVQGLVPGVFGFLTAVGPSHKYESFMALVTRTADLAQGVTSITELYWKPIYFLQRDRYHLLHRKFVLKALGC